MAAEGERRRQKYVSREEGRKEREGEGEWGERQKPINMQMRKDGDDVMNEAKRWRGASFA